VCAGELQMFTIPVASDSAEVALSSDSTDVQVGLGGAADPQRAVPQTLDFHRVLGCQGPAPRPRLRMFPA